VLTNKGLLLFADGKFDLAVEGFQRVIDAEHKSQNE